MGPNLFFLKKNLSKRNPRHKIYLNLWKNLTGSKQLLMLLYSLIIRLNSVIDPIIKRQNTPLGTLVIAERIR